MGRKRLRRGKKRKPLVVLLVILALIIGAYAVFNARVKPLITRMAASRVSNIATQAINDAVTAEISSGYISYDRLISLEKDADGKVTALKTDMAEVNRLKSEISNKILDQIEVYTTSDLNIPLGSVISDDLLAGRGPRIPIRIVSVSAVSAGFENEFTAAGINQTRHQIILKIRISVNLLLPGYTAVTTVDSAVSVAETVLVGSVPESYTYFEKVEDAEEAAELYYNYN